MIKEALDFIDLYYKELGKSPKEKETRKQEILKNGTFRPNYDELEYGCMLAWRNNTHCIGKPHWKSLKVLDCRDYDNEEKIFKALITHISYATNNGNIIPTISIFPPMENLENEIRIWNSQLIRYAGYKDEDGNIIGDPENVELTNEILKLGWKPINMNNFDILPLVIQIGHNPAKYFEIPKNIIKEVDIAHPRNDLVSKIGMKWHALPVISNMYIEIGGIKFTAAPFNGWYMNLEIAQNLGNHNRYDFLPAIAEALGIAIIKEEKKLWEDVAFAELSIAIYHSFHKEGIKMIDQHTASKQFMHFVKTEKQKFNRDVPAKYSWIVPACASSLLEVYHMRMEPTKIKPLIDYNSKGWARNEVILPRGEINIHNNKEVCPYKRKCNIKIIIVKIILYLFFQCILFYLIKINQF